MLRSTFAGFTTAQLGMQASQKALDISGQNIANVNTEGYTRQRLDMVSLNTQNGSFYSSTTATNVGFGVDITGVSQIRNPYLDTQYRSQASRTGASQSAQDALDMINRIFDETGRDAVKTGLSDLGSNLSALSNPTNVGNQVFDTTVRSSCQVLVSYFNQYSTSLNEARSELVSGLENDSTEINTLLSEIATMNETIKNSQVLGNTALELIDSRNLKLDELAAWLPIDVKYSTQNFSGGISTDILNVSFRDVQGVSHTLIDDNRYGSLSIQDDSTSISFFVTDTKGVKSADLKDSLAGGSFENALKMLNRAGDFSGDETAGLPFYQQYFDAFVNEFATTMNSLNSQTRTVDNGDGTTSAITENHPLFVASGGADAFTASNIRISDDWINGNIRIITASSADAGSTANDNVLKMLNALSQKREFAIDGETFYLGNFQECYTNMETAMGIASNTNSALLENNQTVLNQIANARDSVSGVSLDEEGINLLQYQQAFSASARLMTTLDEALDKLINGTGVVGR
ncbi:flagellar hook-associated protein FlgK [Parasporobacterium paucivorans]|uniref:Flagellar hook-associated protein 1 n=1 Tax=Parasporobacterium paucivorans DSM 15970 TaxID=1122934 RepID=A0A1M6I6F0_9FIRM|nr:flagellar hook-associated protein FlgK [Parasporobacterium paucivorans]SHJ30015.1 flagellar hook-associated protein 1 FlgK [Parasporobacterium paucivorans DSM 15970]